MHWSKDLKSLRRGVRLATRATLAQLRQNVVAPAAIRPAVPQGFALLPAFSPNPGRLRALTWLPSRPIRTGAPLIVLLHGCGQEAASFATDSGWTALADRLALPLLLPEQRDANHGQRCFQWFRPEEIARGCGEAGSIAAMVSRAIAHFGSDRGRVFIAGLSAGGAMAASVLAAHPELFSAGAVVAGLPVGTAGNAMAALGRMATGGPDRHPDAWAASVRSTRPKDHAGTWPRLSVWHGASDDIVVPANGEQLAKEWAALHRLPEAPPDAGGVHRRWGEAVEFWRLPGLAHGWPVAAGGNAGKFTFDNPVPAVPMIARFWGL